MFLPFMFTEAKMNCKWKQLQYQRNRKNTTDAAMNIHVTGISGNMNIQDAFYISS